MALLRLPDYIHNFMYAFLNISNFSMCFMQLYGAATMNNTLGLGIFAALVYFRDLDWQYSAGKNIEPFIHDFFTFNTLLR